MTQPQWGYPSDNQIIIGYNAVGAGANTTTIGSSATTATKITAGTFAFDSGFGSAAIAYGCRAWVNFNGATPTIRASANVSSVTKSATGRYQINFTNSMSDTNYSATVGTSDQCGGPYSFNVGYVLIFSNNPTGSGIDSPYICATIVR